MDNEITATVPATLIPRIVKIIERINKKLTSFELATVVFLYSLRYEGNENVTTQMADISIALPEISDEGWRLVAILKPGITESYSYLLPGSPVESIPEQYRSGTVEDARHCEHCNKKRARNTTVLLHHEETGRWIRVGSTCVAEFLGGSAERVMTAIRSLDRLRNELKNPQEIQAERAYSARAIAATCTDLLIRGDEYVNRRTAKDRGIASTAYVVRGMLDEGYEPSGAAVAFIEKALTWLPKHLDEVDPDRDRDYHRNLETAFEYDGDGQGYVLPSAGFGEACSFPMFVKRHVSPSKNSNQPIKGWFGIVGQQYEFENSTVTHKSREFASKYRSGEYLCFYTVLLCDKDSEYKLTFCGNVDLAEKGDKVNIRGTVKSHEMFREMPQTRLFRVKMV